jgi:hypothetical protein
MPARKKTTPETEPEGKTTTKKATDTALKLPDIKMQKFTIWLIGHTPLICHAWSEKAKESMLAKQVKDASEGLKARDPEQDFEDSLYEMTSGVYGFPVTAVKKALLQVAHKDRGVPRETVRGAMWLHAGMVRVRPAKGGAICDMPLVQIYGSKPEMREDMVRVGAGLNKKATLSYRAQFTTWALRIKGLLNVSVCPMGWVPFLATHAGIAVGVGDWRNEKNGMFGAFHVASEAERAAWERFRAGKGPLPDVEDWAAKYGLDDDDDYELPEAAE